MACLADALDVFQAPHMYYPRLPHPMGLMPTHPLAQNYARLLGQSMPQINQNKPQLPAQAIPQIAHPHSAPAQAQPPAAQMAQTQAFPSPQATSRPAVVAGKLAEVEQKAEGSGDARAESEQPDRDVQAANKEGRALSMAPPPPINRVAPPQQQLLAGYSPHHYPPPQSMAGYKLGLLPQVYPSLLGLNQARLALAQQQALNVNPHTAGLLAPQSQGQLSPAHLQRRDPRSSVHSANRASPTPSTARANSQSPAQSAAPVSKVEFLPKAVNVRTPPSSKPATMSQTGGVASQIGDVASQTCGVASQSAGQPLFMPPPHQVQAPTPQLPHLSQLQQPFMAAATNPFLQRELYSYIVQTEGQRAADMFVQQSVQRNQTFYYQMQLRQHLLQQQQLMQHGQPLMMQNAAASGGLPPPKQPPVLNASDLERQWQEESARGATFSQPAHAQPLFINPNVQSLSQESSSRRQSPFGDGPQPYSRLNEEQKQVLKQTAGASDVTDPLLIDVIGEPSHAERELRSLHVDSSVTLSPGGTRSKAPLYMRRVGQNESAAAPRLSYASALCAPTTTGQNIDDIPDRTPQTVGPFTPEDKFFLNRFQPHSADSTASSIGQDPLDILRNLTLQESPPDSNGHSFARFGFQ